MNIFQFSTKMKCPPHTHNCINHPVLLTKVFLKLTYK